MHKEIMEQAHAVQFALMQSESNQLAKQYGIKGICIISWLSSISLSKSFPYDFMHLIWENLIKNLVLLWTGAFKGLDEGLGSYQLTPTVWDAIGAATAASGSTIPGCYGARPPNILSDHSSTTADTWSFWTLYLGPVLLRQKFNSIKYYNHFTELVRLLHLCLQFTLTVSEIDTIRKGFKNWVVEFERLYYQHDPQHISTCPLTIHALLHIADIIEACGPVWAYWAFPMERYCGLIRPAIKSRKHPFASLDRYVVKAAQIIQIQLIYNLSEQPLSLVFKPVKKATRMLEAPEYETCALLPPSRSIHPNDPIMRKIEKCLATRYDKSNNIQIIKQCLVQATIEQWGKVRICDGDTISAAALYPLGDDRRDATYVRYEILVDNSPSDLRGSPERQFS
ncbi:hypothetical protein EWM64_g8222 [Hericium alpestre]|uniref:DUF4218 domain-containing protein n=1 Tax=Hericium alpestre TaxID=135208 RepID=A0A4Y9ZNF5_9AGAM|nr:hypothetical protein EWM64_g8222 [Hericium alpestre]